MWRYSFLNVSFRPIVGFLLCVWFSNGCFCQSAYARQLTVNDGLPQGQVRGMVQDKQGFIWIASEGLSRYDGRNFLNFKHTVGDSATIADNDIRDLQIDDRDNLWLVYASKQVDVVNAKTGLVRHLSAEPAFNWLTSWTPNHVHFTIRQVNGRYFAATNNALAAFDFITGKFSVLKITDTEKLTALGSDDHKNLVLSTTKALYRLIGYKLQLLSRFPSPPDTVYKNWIAVLDSKKSIGTILRSNHEWIIPAVGGILQYNPKANTSVYTGQPGTDRIPYTAVSAADGNIYYSLDSGIYKVKGDVPPELAYGNGGYPPMYALLLADRSGMLWASADVYGIRLFNLRPENFRSLPYKTSFAVDVVRPWLPPIPKGVTFGSYEMRSAKDTGGNIWLLNQLQLRQGSNVKQSSGLYKFNNSTATIQPLYPEKAVPVFISFDKRNQCWLVLQDTTSKVKRTLVKANLQSGSIQPFAALPGGWKENGYLSSVGRYICYLSEDELRLYDTATGAFTVYPKENLGVSGLLLMALPDRKLNDFLWIATKGSGIIKLNIKTGTVQHYAEAEGLPNNTVYYIAPDKKGFFWCSSNKGLFRFNPADGSSVSFTVKDGLQGNEFNRYHFLETPDGHFMFGGTDGYTVFHPDSVYLDDYPTPVAVTSLQVNNIPIQQLGPKWKDSIASNLNHITLPYNQNGLTFSFAGLQYNAPEKLQYRYMLQGIDKTWVEAGNDASAKYAAIPPGHYTLLVNAANTSGFWSSQVKSIQIVISPPWWRTWWMYCLYAAAVIGAGFFFFTTRLKRLQLNQQVVLRQKEAEQARHMEEIKSRFFANITHELRTPLTLILSPVQKQLQEGAATYSPQLLKGVYQNSQTLLRLINQLLDMSKLESGNMPLTLYRGNVVAFTESLLPPFQQQALAKNITFNIKAHETTGDYLFDSDKLEKIVYNLLSNAFKFTPEGGQVLIDVACKPAAEGQDTFTLQVSDTGIGIPEAHLPNIFDRFYQVNTSSTRKYEGTGIGLSLVKELTALMGGVIKVESTVGKGSVFTVLLPLRAANDPEVPVAEYAVVSDVPAEQENTLVNQVADGSCTILVTDDNEQLRNFIQEALSPNYKVLTAANGAEGLEVAVNELPDIIISDVMMPVMDGYEFCNKAKENPLTSHIGFILLTAKIADESRMGGLRSGADHYLGKPFIVEELLLVVSNLLKRQQKLREFYSRQLSPNEKQPQVNEVEDSFLRSVYTTIENNLDNPALDVEFLSSALAITRRTLNRKLASIAATSANEVIRNYRLKKSAELLLRGHSVSEAAYKTGFSTPSWFTQCFKEMFGVTPVKYAENDAAS